MEGEGISGQKMTPGVTGKAGGAFAGGRGQEDLGVGRGSERSAVTLRFSV